MDGQNCFDFDNVVHHHPSLSGLPSAIPFAGVCCARDLFFGRLAVNVWAYVGRIHVAAFLGAESVANVQ